MSQTSPNASTLPTDRYWAGVEREQLPDAIRAKALAFRARRDREGLTDICRRAERTYYGRDPDGGYKNSVAVTYGGEQGELVMIRVNHFQSIIQGLLATTTKERPAFDAIAMSSDSKSLAAVNLADAILEYYYRETGLEIVRNESGRMAIVLGESFTALRWNPHIGKVHEMRPREKYEGGQMVMETVEQPQEPEVDPETGEPIDLPPLMVEQPVMEMHPEKEGDVEGQVFSPIEVVRDLDAPSRDLEWCCVPYRENVWDLAARYPEHEPAIIAQRGAQQRWPRSALCEGMYEAPQTDNDSVDVWHLYHMPCDALPEGRHAQVVGDVVIFDGPMELPEVPVYACIPEREMRRATGFSPQFNLLALQEAYDALWTTLLTAHDAFGIQSIVAAEGSNVKPERLAKGLQLITFKPNPAYPNGGPPTGVNFLSIPNESFDLLDRIQRLMETLSGINSVVRGDPMPQLKSGAALALVQSLAVAFNSQLAGAITQHDERVATGLLRLVQKYALNKRTVEVVGAGNARSLKEWSAESLEGVQRVAVQIVSPLLAHTAGKMEIADKFWNATKPDGTREITTAEYMEILNTGTFAPKFKGPIAAAEYIGRENEMLTEAKRPAVMLTDDHVIHTREHTCVLASPEARANPAIKDAVLAHIQEHQRVWATMGPELATLTGQSVMPPVMAPPVDPNAPPPSGKPGAPPGKPPAERAKPLGKPGPEGMPLMPENPMTGQRVPA